MCVNSVFPRIWVLFRNVDLSVFNRRNAAESTGQKIGSTRVWHWVCQLTVLLSKTREMPYTTCRRLAVRLLSCRRYASCYISLVFACNTWNWCRNSTTGDLPAFSSHCRCNAGRFSIIPGMSPAEQLQERLLGGPWSNKITCTWVGHYCHLVLLDSSEENIPFHFPKNVCLHCTDRVFG